MSETSSGGSVLHGGAIPLVLCVMAASGCDQYASVSGRVIDGETGSPVPGAEIDVLYARSGLKDDDTTNVEGNFGGGTTGWFDDGEKVIVTVKAEGYEVKRVEGALRTEDGARFSLDFGDIPLRRRILHAEPGMRQKSRTQAENSQGDP